ncbi:MAG TPA: DinB family protein [Thermomicrobiales bacterium]|nr:DinB family protein [Thermomicrobiales bacterium]
MESPLATIQAVLTTTAPRWSSLTATLPADLLALAPAPGEWSAHECLQHLCDTERWVFPVRVRAFLAGQDFPAFDPDAEGSVAAGRSPKELAADFADLRAASLAALATVTAADLARTARHSELGQVTLGQMLHEWTAHDLMHTVQAERALLQPFIPASGPWRSYFRDHDVAAK